ncbi:MAG: response regulator transcription factor [Armatimonadota bacterium]|nr:response regulator transcription factor [Armatimonadota bacterium]MDR7534439.1 response regulator transcription factor [Armatimonadota bacterium]MDR7535010.1 response regulator transcription factor [Armatimonadota bacterium]
MSKQRPSTRGRTRTALRYWAARLARASYTRRGRLIRLRTWTVKIQHQGRRRTFSLGAVPRLVAARRARALYATIVTRGWQAALDARSTPGGRRGLRTPALPAPGLQPRYWRRRLLTRRYTEGLRPQQAGELSARIEHAGESHYFPLGTADPALAARRAASIYRTVLDVGWARARAIFPREITVAIFWSANPLASTYTTLYTEPAESGGPTGAPGGAGMPSDALARAARLIGVVEPDPGVRRALAAALALHPERWTVAPFAVPGEVLRLAPQLEAAAVLLNRALPDAAGVAAELATQRPDLPVFQYGVYQDSDQLFLSFGGVAAGYILRRRPPARLLEPLGPPPGHRPLAAGQAAARIRRYFEGLFAVPSAAEATAMVRLTPREQEILDHLSKGYLDREIAARLGISSWTVHHHLRSIFAKLQVRTRTEAAIRYLQK